MKFLLVTILLIVLQLFQIGNTITEYVVIYSTGSQLPPQTSKALEPLLEIC